MVILGFWSVHYLTCFLPFFFLASNLGVLMELVKDGTKKIVQPTQQQGHGIQSQLQPQHQNALRLTQQVCSITYILSIWFEGLFG